MSGSTLYWILVFTASSLEHLAERDIDEVDVANAVFGEYGVVFVRHIGSGRESRWLIIAPQRWRLSMPSMRGHGASA